MDDVLRGVAVQVLERLPASVEMPAGTGKTQIVAALAAVASDLDGSTLILTHTHAGVDAIRRRLRRFEVPGSQVHVDTIAGWAFDLVRSYPQLAGMTIPSEPNWALSRDYVLAATRVMQSPAIRRVHQVSFSHLVVDEYQDCVASQHLFVESLRSAMPKACVFGDRMQGIFRFGQEDLVQWDAALAAKYPPVSLKHTPWRWIEANPQLGSWLLTARLTLQQRQPLTLDTSLPGVVWMNIKDRRSQLAAEANRLCALGGSVLIIGKWARDCAEHAANVYGFGVMEELQGKFMNDFLSDIDQLNTSAWPNRLVRLAKDCFVGLAALDAAVMSNLDNGKGVGHLRRESLDRVLTALDVVLATPSHGTLRLAMDAIEGTAGVRLIRREAWNDIRSVLSVGADIRGEPAVQHLARVRDRIRRNGRRSSSRIVSRTLLVKGLEYDHVIVADAEGLGDRENLYVALTRARKSITVFSRSQTISY